VDEQTSAKRENRPGAEIGKPTGILAGIDQALTHVSRESVSW
jgi:hypothetical protein